MAKLPLNVLNTRNWINLGMFFCNLGFVFKNLLQTTKQNKKDWRQLLLEQKLLYEMFAFIINGLHKYKISYRIYCSNIETMHIRLLLTNENVTVLGGKVDALYSQFQFEQSINNDENFYHTNSYLVVVVVLV
jgi:hypothetical protein